MPNLPMRPRVLLFLLLVTSPAVTATAQESVDTLPTRPDSTRAVPATLQEVMVTGTRAASTVGALPFNTAVIGRDALRQRASFAVPAVLQQLTGFTLGNYGHPVTQRPERSAGAFRGLGGTSASRALVLLDGIPVNDPFNGQVRWSRIPLSLVDRVEVVRGGGSMAWGSRALSGVIQLVTARPDGARLEGLAEGGGLSTAHLALSGSARAGRLEVLGAADLFDSDGFLWIRDDQAGAVDRPRGIHSAVGYASLRYQLTPNLVVHAGGNYVDDQNRGETPLTSRTATTGELRGGLDWATPDGGLLSVLWYGAHRTSRFSVPSVSTDRNSETMRRATSIPSSSQGGTVQWAPRLGARHEATVGMEGTWVQGEYHDLHTVVNNQYTRERYAGGRQLSLGLFATDGITLSERTRLQLGARAERVLNLEGFRGELLRSTGVALSDTSYPGQDQTILTGLVGVRHLLSGRTALRASAYRSFRSATLFELHTPVFIGASAGSSVIEANPALRPEILHGVEVGLDQSVGAALLVRGTAFWNRVTDPIVEVTLGTATTAGQVIAPCGGLARNTVCRQRRNVGAVRSLGLELDAEWRPLPALDVEVGYAYNPTRLVSPDSLLDGRWTRGAARHSLSAAVSAAPAGVVDLRLEVRWIGTRFDDDRNTIELPSFTLVGASLSRRIGPWLSASLKAENLLDARYPVTRGTSGIEEMGAPRWLLAGLRVQW